MLIEIDTLGDEPLSISGTVPRKDLDFQHEDAELIESVTFSATVALMEERTVRFSGNCRAHLDFQCCRCLEHFQENRRLDFDLVYVPHPTTDEKSREIELRYEEMDLGFYDGIVFDTNLAITEQLLLSVPMKSLCREDCRGLCPQCGKNRNREECDCRPIAVNPLREKLLSLKESLEHKPKD